jgi:hypothetical protein
LAGRPRRSDDLVANPSRTTSCSDLEVARRPTRCCSKPASHGWTARCLSTIKRTRTLFSGANAWNPNNVAARELSRELHYRCRAALRHLLGQCELQGSHRGELCALAATSFKFGFDDNFGDRDHVEERNGGYTYRCATVRRHRFAPLRAVRYLTRLNADIGITARISGRSAGRRSTSGLRYDHLKSSNRPTSVEGNPFVPARQFEAERS